MGQQWIAQEGEIVFLFVQVQPNAKNTEIIGIHNNRLKIRIKAAPEGGAANTMLVNWLAKVLKIHKNDILISAGLASSKKTLKLQVVDLCAVKHSLLRNL